MQCSNIRLRAGLVVLVFALIVSLVSTCPIPLVISLASVALIPATASGVSSCRNPSLNGHQLEFLFSVRMSTLPLATRLIFGVAWLTYYTRQPLSTIMDDQLVRRSIASKLKVCLSIFSLKEVRIRKLIILLTIELWPESQAKV